MLGIILRSNALREASVEFPTMESKFSFDFYILRIYSNWFGWYSYRGKDRFKFRNIAGIFPNIFYYYLIAL